MEYLEDDLEREDRMEGGGRGGTDGCVSSLAVDVALWSCLAVR